MYIQLEHNFMKYFLELQVIKWSKVPSDLPGQEYDLTMFMRVVFTLA
jgi:hypothetical protein